MNKILYHSFFKNKKITVMGLGVLGRGIQVTKFLAECGAKVTVTDLKTKKQLIKSIDLLKKYKIKYILGKHNLNNFEKVDMVVKSAGVPLDSIYILHAKSLGIPVVMDASIFTKIINEVDSTIKIIGVTGTRGKSMTTALIYYILNEHRKKLGKNVYLGGNMRMKATLPILKRISSGDVVVLELDSWQCQGFGDEKLSPNISVFTSFMPDHMNYYKNSLKNYFKDKSHIFKFQKKDDVFITNNTIHKIIKEKLKSRLIISATTKIAKVPMHILGKHNLQNTAYAYEVAKLFGLTHKDIIKSLKSFNGLGGGLEYSRKIRGVHIINDNNATTPQATVAGIEAVKFKYRNSKIILISGGSDKKLKLDMLVKAVNKNCDHVVLLSGTGTEVLKSKISKKYYEYAVLKDSVGKAISLAKKGDVVLFSPGFASFGLFLHEYDRNDQFIKILKSYT